MRALLVNTEKNIAIDPSTTVALNEIAIDLQKSNWQVQQMIAYRGNDLSSALSKFNPNVVFCYDYVAGDQKDLRQICQEFRIPEIFSSSSSLQVMLDKSKTKNFAQKIGIPILPSINITSKESDITQINFPGPYFIKPLFGGDSRGIGRNNVFTDPKEALIYAKKQAISSNETQMIEQFFQAKECIEIAYFRIPSSSKDIESLISYKYCKPKDQKYKYLSKYIKNNGKKHNLQLASYNGEYKNILYNMARRICESISADGVIRAEFLISNKLVYFLEINGIPGINKCFDLTALQCNIPKHELTNEMFLGAIRK